MPFFHNNPDHKNQQIYVSPNHDISNRAHIIDHDSSNHQLTILLEVQNSITHSMY